MASLYFSAMEDANARVRSALRATRNRFLAYRDPAAQRWCAELDAKGSVTDVRGDVLRIGFGLYHDEEDVEALAALAKELN